MTDHDDGPLEFVERQRQRLARRQIQVVGRLVEQQQVGTLPDDHGQYETRLLAAAHRPHRLLDHVAAEVERAQEGAQILFAVALPGRPTLSGQSRQVFQRGVARAQDVELLLGKVADVESFAFTDAAAGARQGAGYGLDQR